MKFKITEQFDKSKYTKEYIKSNIKQYRFTLNQKTEKDLIEWLDGKENKQGYLKKLIRDDIKNHMNS